MYIKDSKIAKILVQNEIENILANFELFSTFDVFFTSCSVEFFSRSGAVFSGLLNNFYDVQFPFQGDKGETFLENMKDRQTKTNITLLHSF